MLLVHWEIFLSSRLGAYKLNELVGFALLIYGVWFQPFIASSKYQAFNVIKLLLVSILRCVYICVCAMLHISVYVLICVCVYMKYCSFPLIVEHCCVQSVLLELLKTARSVSPAALVRSLMLLKSAFFPEKLHIATFIR